MKHLVNFLSALCVVLALASCRAKMLPYYQVFKATPVDEMIESGEKYVFEDSNCRIIYHFWEDGGNPGFAFYNKTDENIYLNKAESFFILNGNANDYYRNREFNETNGYSRTSGVTVTTGGMSTVSQGYSATDAARYTVSAGGSAAATRSRALGITAPGVYAVSGSSVGASYSKRAQASVLSSITSALGITQSSFQTVSHKEEETKSHSRGTTTKEQDVVCIPPQSMKVIEEYTVRNQRYYDCDLYANPKNRQQILIKKFNQSNSPIVFSNLITYSIGDSKQPVTLENSFYVSAIANYPKSELVKTKTIEPGVYPNCEGKRATKFSFIQYYPGQFFIYYTERSKNKLHH